VKLLTGVLATKGAKAAIEAAGGSVADAPPRKVKEIEEKVWQKAAKAEPKTEKTEKTEKKAEKTEKAEQKAEKSQKSEQKAEKQKSEPKTKQKTK
jgi:hypothetical protein